jgi:hypothetical protein
MKTLNPIENEINKIRLAIYEKTKDMTPSQLTDYYLKSGENSARKYGFTIVQNARDKDKEQRAIQANS